ncbi:MAG: hypothetical protein ISR58_06975 [Anaerolineales bacterium]|nr:hypothetical protein [Chloroflexota bacterium]MBL6980918.1 hypothetical protein [Anaerolineales bacterium]
MTKLQFHNLLTAFSVKITPQFVGLILSIVILLISLFAPQAVFAGPGTGGTGS